MKTKVINMKNKRNHDVYIGRSKGFKHMNNTKPKKSGWLGNPYPLKEHSREESITKFKKDFHKKIENNRKFREAVKTLEGKTLGCWCKPKPCHGDVIVEYLEGEK